MDNEPIRLAVLGSTGSIGRQALDIARAAPERVHVVALAAGHESDELGEQAAAFAGARVGIGEAEAAAIASSAEVDVVLNGIVGSAGLGASVAALTEGKTLLLANKESLVAGGRVCVAAAKASGARIVPVDSEHAALAQLLAGTDPAAVERIVLTASGGPFRERADLASVTPREALRHPTWSMGPKITVDSATLMNKGLEVIEAHHLFGYDYDRIDVLVHPQSLVHGIVEHVDGTVTMQAAPTDMRIPIQAALLGARADAPPVSRLDLAAAPDLTFEPVDHDRFPSLSLAYEAGKKGGSYPTVLNAANEKAVEAFLADGIGFTAMAGLIEDVLAAHDRTAADDLADVLAADAWARAEAARLLESGDRYSR